MRIDFYSKSKIERVSLVGCEITQVEYDYENRLSLLVCRNPDTQQEHRLTFCDTLFFSLENQRDSSSVKIITDIGVVEDCVPLRQLREFQAKKQAEGKSDSSPYLQDDAEFLQVQLETTDGTYLFICTALEYKEMGSGKQSKIDEIFDMLDCGNPQETQQKGIELAGSVEHLFVFLKPWGNRRIWENCAIILSKRTDEELSNYMDQLFDWAVDSGCPGAKIIKDRLSFMCPEFLITVFSARVMTVKEENNLFQLFALKAFAEKCQNLFDLLPLKVRESLINWEQVKRDLVTKSNKKCERTQ